MVVKGCTEEKGENKIKRSWGGRGSAGRLRGGRERRRFKKSARPDERTGGGL